MEAKKKPILVAISVVVKRVNKNKKYQILTQTRHVINKNYDPMYDGTEEVVGETVKENETLFDTAVRGCEEELGVTDFETFIDGRVGGHLTSTFSCQEGEKVVIVQDPFIFIQQLEGPQPWAGIGFIFFVNEPFEPNLKKADGETAGFTWWEPKKLYEELINNPTKFMGFHYPLLKRACEIVMDL